MYFVYMLRCGDGSLYTGITNDLKRRLAAHNAGTASKYTRSHRPVTLCYLEEAEDKSAALRRELELKKLTKPEKETLVSAWIPEDIPQNDGAS